MELSEIRVTSGVRMLLARSIDFTGAQSTANEQIHETGSMLSTDG